MNNQKHQQNVADAVWVFDATSVLCVVVLYEKWLRWCVLHVYLALCRWQSLDHLTFKAGADEQEPHRWLEVFDGSNWWPGDLSFGRSAVVEAFVQESLEDTEKSTESMVPYGTNIEFYIQDVVKMLKIVVTLAPMGFFSVINSESKSEVKDSMCPGSSGWCNGWVLTKTARHGQFTVKKPEICWESWELCLNVINKSEGKENIMVW